jgi:hypothetical protein
MCLQGWACPGSTGTNGGGLQPRELLDAALREWVGEHGGLPACRTRAIEVQMATVRST